MNLESGQPANSLVPPPRLVEPESRHLTGRTRRAQALRAWLDSQMEIDETPVALPLTDSKLNVFQPTPASREQLFVEARATAERQLPYWADIWPSGLAMGSFVLQYADQLAGQRVLEIGSGLGTTAAATLQAGATVLALDYTPLALGLCRYNSLINVGSAPRTLPVNWRNLSEHSLARLKAGGRYPIIMAADVLYESRDIEPLIELISSLLAPDGMLWLSEPGRKVAARFLNTLAERGWRCTTHSVDGPWANGATDRINVHFLRQEVPSDLPFGTVGGWRV